LIFRSSKEAAEHLLLHPPTHESRSFLLQHYVTPSLYNLRKYDLRCFILGLQIGPCLRFYWYEEGYVRTASRKFSMKGTAKGIHLTNDAVQKHLKHYGEHEPNNKLSFQELDKYMLNNETFSLYKDVLPQMKTIARDTCQAVGERLGGKSDVAFELMGLDFLVDELGRPWLLEVNTNPSLETSCNLLTRIIPEVL
jgi:tubulin--tyrosine ligase